MHFDPNYGGVVFRLYVAVVVTGELLLSLAKKKLSTLLKKSTQGVQISPQIAADDGVVDMLPR